MLPAHGQSSELTERKAIRSSAFTDVKNANFERLEALAEEYRNPTARTASGVWKLTYFYSGIAAALHSQRKDPAIWSAKQKLVANWVRRYPKSPSAHLAYAEMLVNRGWAYRGDGYANTVAPENWKPFKQYLQQAREYLEKNKQIAAADPQFYAQMISLASVQGWSEAELTPLLEEGLSRFPEYYGIYFAAVRYWDPKWGGNAASLEQFAQDALKRTQPSEGYGMYTRIYWYASENQYGNNLFSESQAKWSLMKKGIADILAKYPDNWNINSLAFFACLARDRAETAALVERIDTPIPEAWADALENYQRCRTWAQPRSRPVDE
ncbi:cytoplasmic protein [Chitinivorax sp. B]|uniref:cytoplasmic protein n=1 Tax=Chitinivorax sp. B TaxID=2502235 RepID=UPI00148503F5|nr:cytoplasmic protein [Chitinivorax sp. B]